MQRPFVIFALPRSRTAWLANFLSQGGGPVGHDTAIEANSFNDLLDRLHGMEGTVETGAMLGYRLLRHALPASKVVTVRRPAADVIASLAAQGITGVDAEIHARDRLLDEIEACGVTRVDFDSLKDPKICGALFESLTGRRFDFHQWTHLDINNVQIDMPGRLANLCSRAETIQALKSDVQALTEQLDGPCPPQFVRISREPFLDFWADAAPLAETHYQEVNAGSRLHHPFLFDTELVAKLETLGSFRVYAARVNGVLAAYCTWSISPDVESRGVTLADQGGWYVSPNPTFKRLHLGRRVLEHSIADLKISGVHSLQFHHQLNGRGSKAGSLLKRLGAEPLQHRYAMWIG